MTENNTIKITDIAMGISLFNSDYSEVRGRSCAPIRWQPWESILLVSDENIFLPPSMCNNICFHVLLTPWQKFSIELLNAYPLYLR